MAAFPGTPWSGMWRLATSLLSCRSVLHCRERHGSAQGAAATHFFIVKSGTLRAEKDGSALDLTRCDFFNEEALTGDGAIAARTVTATVDGTILLQLERRAFLQVVGDITLDEYLAQAKNKKRITMALRSPRTTSEDTSGSSDPRVLHRLPALAEAEANESGVEVGLCRHDEHPDELFTLRVHAKARVLRLKQETEVMKERVLLRTIRAAPGDDIAAHFFPELLRTYKDTRCLYSLFRFPCACDLAELMAGDEKDGGREAN